MKRISSLVILALAAALPAQVTYYTDPVAGNDLTNNGLTPSTAFKSMTHAATVLATGDTLVVLPGTYDDTVETSWPVRFGQSSQENLTIIGVGGPSQTIVDGGGTYAGIGMIRFQEGAKGSRLTGFSFANMADGFWSCALRLGSSTGDAFRCVDVEIDNCVFESTISRPFVLFGANAGARQSTGNKIHNNLIIDNHPNRQTCSIYGDGTNYFYNNVIIHDNAVSDRASIYLDSIVPTAPSNAVIMNNIITGGSGSVGIEAGPTGGATVTIENNNCWNHNVNYKNVTPSGTNVSVDPMFVSATDYRLQAASTMIDAGSNAVPTIRHDLDYSPAAFAAGTKGRITDIGAYEYHTNDFVMTAPPTLGGSVDFSFTGTGGLGGVLLGFNEVSFLAPFGVVLADTLFFAATTSSPGIISIPVPNVPSAEGFRVVFQGIYSGAALELLNVRHTYIRK